MSGNPHPYYGRTQKPVCFSTRGECEGQVLGKVRRTVIAHVPMEDASGVAVSHLRIFPKTGRTRLDSPSLLEVEAGLVCLSEPHSISLSSPRC